MYSVTEQSLSAADKELLARFMPSPPGPFHGLEHKIIIRGFVLLIFGGLIGVLIRDLRWNFSVPRLLFIMAFFVFVWMQINELILRPRRLHRQKKIPFNQFQKALSAATVATVQRIESKNVVQIDSDEGAFYLFSTGPNQTYWSDLDGPPDSWPNSKFDVFRIPGFERDLGPLCHGELIEPRRSVLFRDYFGHFDFEQLPKDGLIMDAPDAFLARSQAQSPPV
jgi:hypothetical protein